MVESPLKRRNNIIASDDDADKIAFIEAIIDGEIRSAQRYGENKCVVFFSELKFDFNPIVKAKIIADYKEAGWRSVVISYEEDDSVISVTLE